MKNGFFEAAKSSIDRAILGRGKAIYESGNVVILRADQDSFEARVQGQEVYRVEGEFGPGKDLTYLSCTCPYFERTGEICKHAAAVLMSLEDAELPIVRKQVLSPTRAGSDKTWNSFLAEMGALRYSNQQQYCASLKTILLKAKGKEDAETYEKLLHRAGELAIPRQFFGQSNTALFSLIDFLLAEHSIEERYPFFRFLFQIETRRTNRALFQYLLSRPDKKAYLTRLDEEGLINPVILPDLETFPDDNVYLYVSENTLLRAASSKDYYRSGFGRIADAANQKGYERVFQYLLELPRFVLTPEVDSILTKHWLSLPPEEKNLSVFLHGAASFDPESALLILQHYPAEMRKAHYEEAKVLGRFTNFENIELACGVYVPSTLTSFYRIGIDTLCLFEDEVRKFDRSFLVKALPKTIAREIKALEKNPRVSPSRILEAIQSYQDIPEVVMLLRDPLLDTRSKEHYETRLAYLSLVADKPEFAGLRRY